MLILDTGKNLECIKEIVETGNCYVEVDNSDSNSRLDLTIIIPSHNRHDYIKSSMNYYKLFGIKCIYVDSSDSQYKDCEYCQNIQYVYLPGYSFIEKMIYVLERVKTNYICACADDDFLIYEEVIKGYDFLKQCPEYVQYFGFNFSFFRKNNSFRLIGTKEEKRNINGDIWERSHKFFSRYRNVLWTLSKKDVLLKGYQMLNMAKFQNHNFYELMLGTNFCFHGKIFISENLWLIREVNDQSWGRQHQSLITINKRSREFKDDYQSFIKITNAELCHDYGRYSFKIYLKSGYKRKILNIRSHFFWIIKKIIKKILRRKND